MTPTPRQLHATAQAARSLHAALSARLTPAIDTITATLDIIDGYPTSTTGPDGSKGNDTTSSTERAALRRLAGRNDPTGTTTPADELDDLLRAHRHLLRLLHQFCDRWVGQLTAADLERLRCIGTGDTDGATCTQIADATRSDGRCVDCGPTVDKRRRADAQRKRDARYGRTVA